MFIKKITPLFIATALIVIGCASPSALTSDEITHASGIVIDQNYERVAHAEIHFAEEGKSVRTDDNGIFTLREIGVGTHTVSISADGHGTAEKSIDIQNEGTRLQLKID